MKKFVMHVELTGETWDEALAQYESTQAANQEAIDKHGDFLNKDTLSAVDEFIVTAKNGVVTVEKRP